MIRKLLPVVFVLPLVAASVLLVYAAADGAWLSGVPSRDHEKISPYQGQPDAVLAGRRVFEEHCAGCHGDNAQGKKKRPPLRSQRVQQQATVGDLHWLLVNGNMRKGMPSWSKLGDPQIWQVVSYVKSLQSK